MHDGSGAPHCDRGAVLLAPVLVFLAVSSLIITGKHDILINKDVKIITRPDFQGWLNVEVPRYGLLRELAEALNEGLFGSTRS